MQSSLCLLGYMYVWRTNSSRGGSLPGILIYLPDVCHYSWKWVLLYSIHYQKEIFQNDWEAKAASIKEQVVQSFHFTPHALLENSEDTANSPSYIPLMIAQDFPRLALLSRQNFGRVWELDIAINNGTLTDNIRIWPPLTHSQKYIQCILAVGK